MFGLLSSHECPSCGKKTKVHAVKLKHAKIKVFHCAGCKGEYVRNKKRELFPVLTEGTILC